MDPYLVRKGLKGWVVLFLLFLSACTSGRGEWDLKRTVIMYNKGLMEAHKNRSFDLLEKVALKKEVDRVRAFVNAYLGMGQMMEPDLKDLTYRDIGIEDGRATVRTIEDWSYRWIDVRTGREVEPLRGIRYEMEYHLVKRNGRWLVEKVRIISEEKGGSGG